MGATIRIHHPATRREIEAIRRDETKKAILKFYRELQKSRAEGGKQ